MDEKYLIILNTNKYQMEGTCTRELLERACYLNHHEDTCGFGNGFFPVIAITKDGQVRSMAANNSTDGDVIRVVENDKVRSAALDGSIVLFVIPDNQEIHDSFIKFVDEKFSDVKCIYALLHSDENPITRHKPQTQPQIDMLKKHFPEKLYVAKSHHTVSKDSPDHVLGNGLEVIAERVDAGKPLEDKDISYLIEKPNYECPCEDKIIGACALIKQYLLSEKGDDGRKKISESLKKELKELEKCLCVKECVENIGSYDVLFERHDKFKELQECLMSCVTRG